MSKPFYMITKDIPTTPNPSEDKNNIITQQDKQSNQPNMFRSDQFQ